MTKMEKVRFYDEYNNFLMSYNNFQGMEEVKETIGLLEHEHGCRCFATLESVIVDSDKILVIAGK